MRKLYTGLLLSLFFLSKTYVFAQLTVTQGAALNMTPLQLIQSRLVGLGVTVSNVTFNGSSANITSNQIGSFDAINGAFTQLMLSGGIIMSSGKVSDAVGPNTLPLASTSMGTPGDADLNALSGKTTHDAAVLEFDFIPIADTLKFQYVFGSEEFFQYCNSNYNDCFGFFLSGPGISGPYSNSSINVAKMPDGVTDVTINNLCSNSLYQWCNAPTTGWPSCNFPRGDGAYFRYNGFSYVFTAWHVVQPCQVYHIKLAVSDAQDDVWDSGVFLQENSFSATGMSVSNTFTHPGLANAAIEGCSNATITFKLQVPTINNDTINYTIGGTATNGVDYTTIPNFVIIPAGMDSINLIIQPLMDNLTEGTESVILNIPITNCSGTTNYHDTVYILDNFTLIANAGNDTSVCLGQSVTLHAQHTGGQPPYTYLWSNGSTVATTTVTPVAGSNIFYVDITDACSATTRDTVVVTGMSQPFVTNTNLIFQVCNGQTTNIVLQSSAPGSTFTWTATCGNGNITGYSAGSGLTINQTLFNAGTTIDTVIYHVTANHSGCTSSQAKNFKVAVIPIADALFSPNGQSICNGASTSISITSRLSGTTFSWTYTLGSANLSGASNGAGPVISQTLFNSGFTIDTVTYHITPTMSGCPGTNADAKAAVKPVPDSWASPASQTICSGNPTSLNLLSHVAGASFSWTASCPSPDISGYGPGSGLSITQTLLNSGLTSPVVTYTVTPAANGCPGILSTTIPVTVKPSPVLTNALTYSVCSGGLTNIILQSNPSPATFTWIASGSSPNVTGFSSGSGGTIAQNLSNSGFSNETVTYAVTPTALGCPGTPTNVVVTVFPTTNVHFTPISQTICSGTAPSIALTSDVSGTNYSWNASGSSGNISGFGPGTGTPINQILNNSGLAFETATYTVIPTANSCTGIPNNVVVTVKPLATVTFTACTDIITTTDANPFTLKGGLPLGGSYSGPGVVAGNFNPSVGPGAHTIVYSYTNVYNCSNTASLSITVLNSLPFTCTDSVIDVRDNRKYPTVKLGSACWMAANLNYGTQILASALQRDNCTNEKFCYNDNASNCTTFGGLYQWDEMMQYQETEAIQGFCPPAWHVPTETEWNTLFSVYVSTGLAGDPLKYSGYSGFGAYLKGIRHDNRNWDFDSFATLLWSSTMQGPYKAWAHGLNSFDPSVSYYPANRSNAFYVRCIKN